MSVSKVVSIDARISTAFYEIFSFGARSLDHDWRPTAESVSKIQISNLILFSILLVDQLFSLFRYSVHMSAKIQVLSVFETFF